MTPEHGWTPIVIEASLIVSTTAAVLAFGGTEPISFAIVEIALLLTAAVALFYVNAFSWREWWPSAGIPIALFVLVALQLLPFPPRILAWLRPGQPVWNVNAPGKLATRYSALSIAPHNTRSQLLVLVCCFAVFFFAQLVARKHAGRQRLVTFLLALGTVEALYGLVQYLSGWQRIFGYVKKYNLEEATGTYINRNHFAGFLEMVIPFALAMLLSQHARSSRRHLQSSLKWRAVLAGEHLPRIGLQLFAVVIMIAGLFFSRSRMGIVAALCTLALMVVFSNTQRKAGMWPAFAVTACVTILVTWLGAGSALGRFGNISGEYLSAEESRLSLWQGTARLIAGHPLLGSGLATFPVAFTKVQDTFLGRFVNHAHNDYLELASDLGVPAALLLFGSIVWLLFGVARIVSSAETSFDRAVPLACLGSIVAILLHSLTDFNLYIPANAMVFSLILGLTSSIVGKVERGDSRQQPQNEA